MNKEFYPFSGGEHFLKGKEIGLGRGSRTICRCFGGRSVRAALRGILKNVT